MKGTGLFGADRQAKAAWTAQVDSVSAGPSPNLITKEPSEDPFSQVCQWVAEAFDREWEGSDDDGKTAKLEREKRAIMGFSKEMAYYKARIQEILEGQKLTDVQPPPWYPNLCEGVFAELYGLAGLAPWAYDMDEKYLLSSSAKLIGDRLYCLIDGKTVLQPQRISRQRRNKLKRALLLATPEERLEKGFHEVYLKNGIRITIYAGRRTKDGEDVMVFRKYVLPNHSFATLVEKGTIPQEAIPLFEKMIQIGCNVLFAGPVRSGKTTFLQIWQKQERTDLEGLAVATDPETPWHKLMPSAPIMQLVADGQDLIQISRSLLRGDNDYVLLEEMRDAASYRLALDITSAGTFRSKGTIHDGDGIDIPYKMATAIVSQYGGNLEQIICTVYKNFDYVIELCQDKNNRGIKRMKGILEYAYDPHQDQVSATYLCRYDFDRGVWLWNGYQDPRKEEKYSPYRAELLELQKILHRLAKGRSFSNWTIFPAYYPGGGRQHVV